MLRYDVFKYRELKKKEISIKDKSPRDLPNGIYLNNIIFGFSRKKRYFDNLNLSIKAGQRIALIGNNGSGKSTCAKIIAGLIQPQEGEVFILGQNMESLTPIDRVKMIGYVGQENFFFEGTLKDNLTLWNSTFKDEQIIEALKMAKALNILESRPEGLYAKVYEGGKNYSGGQLQRLAIARTLLINMPVLILDDALFALDPQLKESVTKEIFSHSDKTIITVSHDLLKMPDFDEIYIFSEGKIVAFGTHDELMKLEFYQKQFENAQNHSKKIKGF